MSCPNHSSDWSCAGCEKTKNKRVLDHIAAMCGNPDAAEGCRLILEKIKEMKGGEE